MIINSQVPNPAHNLDLSIFLPSHPGDSFKWLEQNKAEQSLIQ